MPLSPPFEEGAKTLFDASRERHHPDLRPELEAGRDLLRKISHRSRRCQAAILCRSVHELPCDG
eukprot:4447768-Prorocentrum_lima.AAC.1